MQGFGLHALGFSVGIYGCAWKAAAAAGLGGSENHATPFQGYVVIAFLKAYPPLISVAQYDPL